LWNIYENYTASIVISVVFLINLFSIRAAGFHRREKLFELNFCIGKMFLWMIKPGRQKPCHSQSIYLVPSPERNPCFSRTNGIGVTYYLLF